MLNRPGQATYFNWKEKYDGLLPTEMPRLELPKTPYAVAIVTLANCVSANRTSWKSLWR